MKKWLVPLAAIAGIVAIEITALLHGVDGVLMSLSLVAIAGIGGYKLRDMKD
jgi:hypothetical protein